jgi:hypothetical protein
VLALDLDLGTEKRQFALEVDAAGTVRLEGRQARVEATQACGGGGAGTPGGDPGSDPVEEITRALADRVLGLVEANAGFGTRTTAFVLCRSGRYALESETSAAPGVVTSEVGAWSVALDQGAPVLRLLADGAAAPQAFALTADAQGNLLLNGIPATTGDPSIVGAVCPQIGG